MKEKKVSKELQKVANLALVAPGTQGKTKHNFRFYFSGLWEWRQLARWNSDAVAASVKYVPLTNQLNAWDKATTVC